MSKLIIHQPKNFESRHYRYYNRVFDALIEEIKKEHDVIDNRYFKYANSGWFPVLLLSQDTFFNDTKIHILECEMIIENYDTKGIKVLSVSDDLTSATLDLQNSQYCNKVLISQFDRKKISNHIYNQDNMWKYSPWLYFPQTVQKYDFYWNKRRECKSLKDKIYFRGSCLECRNIILYLNPDLFHGGPPIGGFDMYAEELLNYKVGLSIAGRGEFCYRDIEYMAMGIPFIRFQYNNEMALELKPNYHYISVERPADMPYDKDCTVEHAKLLEQRFYEVKDDVNFLENIAKNAREYYENYITINNCVAHTKKLLELDKW